MHGHDTEHSLNSPNTPHTVTYQVRIWEKHDDIIKWKAFPHYWTFERGIHQLPVNSPHKGQWHGAFMFSLICSWINGWVNKHETGDLRCHRAQYDVTVMISKSKSKSKKTLFNVGQCKQYNISSHLKWVLVADKSMHIDSVIADWTILKHDA